MFKKFTIALFLLISILKIFVVVKSGRVKRLVGGTYVDCGTQPRVASLRLKADLKHRCGATLLSKQFAVTAAHCVLPTTDYVLLLNNYCNDGHSTYAQVIQVNVHELFDIHSMAHDIALLRVSLNLNDTRWLDDNVMPLSSFGLSEECAIFGYGSKSAGSSESTEVLQAGTVDLVSLDFCTDVLGPIAPDNDSGMICALGLDDTCQGDSGSPLICGSTVEGVSSYGQSCGAPGVPAVYTSIAAHSLWIREIMQNA